MKISFAIVGMPEVTFTRVETLTFVNNVLQFEVQTSYSCSDKNFQREFNESCIPYVKLFHDVAYIKFLEEDNI